MAAAVGEPAPGFSLPGTDRTDAGRRTYTLEEFRGRPVVLVFYPGDNTPVCTRQLNAYTSDIEAFEGVGAQVLAVSPQSVESHDEFSCKQGGFAFPLLADEDKAVGEAYGPHAGLAALADVSPDLPRYAAVSAYLHERAGDLEHAARLYAEAARAATSVPERDHLTREAARVRQLLRP